MTESPSESAVLIPLDSSNKSLESKVPEEATGDTVHVAFAKCSPDGEIGDDGENEKDMKPMEERNWITSEWITDQFMNAVMKYLHLFHDEDSAEPEEAAQSPRPSRTLSQIVVADVVGLMIDHLNNICSEASSEIVQCTKAEEKAESPQRCWTPVKMIAADVVKALVKKIVTDIEEEAPNLQPPSTAAKPSAPTLQSGNISGDDIQNVTVVPSTPAEGKERDRLSKSASQSRTASAPKNEAISCVSAAEQDLCVEASSEPSPVPHTRPTEVHTLPPTSVKIQREFPRLGPFSHIIAGDLIYHLLTQVISKCKDPVKSAVNQDEVHLVTTHLKMVVTKVVELKIQKAKSLSKLEYNVDKLICAVTKGVMKEFRSPEQLLEAALLKDPSLERALLKHLNIKLDVFLKTTKKSKVAEFFSDVGKASKKAFRRKDSSED